MADDLPEPIKRDVDRDRMAFEWLSSEMRFTNERIAAYSEADQRIIATMTSIVVAVLTLSASTLGGAAKERIPYVLLLASGLLCFASLQSTLYSALCLVFMERKVRTTSVASRLVGSTDDDLAKTKYSLFEMKYGRSYERGMLTYNGFKFAAGPSLAVAGIVIGWREDGGLVFAVASIAASAAAGASIWITAKHMSEFSEFRQELLKDAPDFGSLHGTAEASDR